MIYPDEALHGKAVVSSDGVVIGEISRLFIDPVEWRVRSIEVRLRKESADRVGIHRTLFHSATIEVSTQQIQSVEVALILSISLDKLRPPAAVEQAPAPWAARSGSSDPAGVRDRPDRFVVRRKSRCDMAGSLA
jgi:sporulation protein YlmC with PRC-barrel domain